MKECSELFNISFVTILGRVVGCYFFLQKEEIYSIFIWIPLHFPFVRLIWKILNCNSSAELSLNCSTLSFH